MEMSGRFDALLLMSTVPLYGPAAGGRHVNWTTKVASKAMVAGVAGATPLMVMGASPV
jgi:hypothetical protein